MPTAFDNFGQNNSSFTGVVTLTSAPFTISGANRLALVGLTILGASSAESCTLGGVTGTIVPGSRSTAIGVTTVLFIVIAPPTGSQTAVCNWTGSFTAAIGVISFIGGDQTTGANGGVIANTFAASASRSVVSSSGDMTCSLATDDSNLGTMTSNQTKKISDYSCMDIGPGTTNPTHTWTAPVGSTPENIQISACNVIQAAGNVLLVVDSSKIAGRPFPYAAGSPIRRR